jgi:hypothetical protein
MVRQRVVVTGRRMTGSPNMVAAAATKYGYGYARQAPNLYYRYYRPH